VHRIGRTGRAGAEGDAISFYSPDEEKYLLDIEKLMSSSGMALVSESVA
jgi:superfamily II DNA/RNA helicase